MSNENSKADAAHPVERDVMRSKDVKRIIIEALYKNAHPVSRDALLMESLRQCGADFNQTHAVIDRLSNAGLIKWRGSGYVAVRP